MTDTLNIARRHRHGEAWGQIGTHDYPCFASKPRTRNLRWLVYGLLGAVALVAWVMQL